LELVKNKSWSREQLLVAFTLYTQIPFGRLHSKNPDIIKHAELIERTPSALAMKLVNIASLDPVITDSGRSGLKAASKADKLMWQEMNTNWDFFWAESELVMMKITGIPITETNNIDVKEVYSAENRIIQTTARYGQNSFREAVISAHDGQCCITGIKNPKLLIASHIIPWSKDKNNRLNPSNGLCLSNLHDKAFDSGLLTLNNNYEVVLSKNLKNEKNNYMAASFLEFEGKRILMPKKFTPDQEFLEFHRTQVFTP
jgi:putative restriction endonuclease